MAYGRCTKHFLHGGRSYQSGECVQWEPSHYRALLRAGLIAAANDPLIESAGDCTWFFVIGSGPSLTAEDVHKVVSLQAAGLCKIIVTNATFKAVPSADYLYGMDAGFWRTYDTSEFRGKKCSSYVTKGVEHVKLSARNSGAGAILLAELLGATRITLLGLDCGYSEEGKRHWHDDHPAGIGNAGSAWQWASQFADMAKRLKAGTAVTNCSRRTAMTCFPRVDLDAELTWGCSPVRIEGMHGMGDNLHQRAIVRTYMRAHIVTLVSPWPQLYEDLRGPRCRIIKPATRLRTQAKNAARSDFDQPAGAVGRTVSVKYPPALVRECRGVLPAMAAQCGVPGASDFSFVVPDAWRVDSILEAAAGRPIVVYRPLVERKEWGGCAARNPDKAAYRELFAFVLSQIPGAFVVSVADVQPGAEWITSDPVDADMTFHAGELHIEQLCALWHEAALIYSAPGFALVLAQAIGRPVISLFGGYERAYSFRDDAKTCKIEPIHPRDDFKHAPCDKSVDMPRALQIASDFLEGLPCRMI